jgi:hypothetical protein
VDDLNKALGDINSIRRQMARSTEFRGYGPATLAATSVIAVGAAMAQALLLPEPALHPATYLGIWMSTGIVSGALIATHMHVRTRRIHSGMADEMIRTAAEQFLPSAVAGALLTIVLAAYVPSAIWLIPGLWQIIFSLGVFSSCRFLPRPIVAAGVWYLLSGLFAVALGDARALSPWVMGIAYGVGQMLVAGILAANWKGDEDEA